VTAHGRGVQERQECTFGTWRSGKRDFQLLRDFRERDAAPFCKIGKALPPLRIGDFDHVNEMRQVLLFRGCQFALILQRQQRIALLPCFRGNRRIDCLKQAGFRFRQSAATSLPCVRAACRNCFSKSGESSSVIVIRVPCYNPPHYTTHCTHHRTITSLNFGDSRAGWCNRCELE
jgi:hypothetical protein